MALGTINILPFVKVLFQVEGPFGKQITAEM